jgi:hypothetical protein
MHPDEIRAVAQAITDAHANKPGNDHTGRIDDAKTVIAAFDAIAKLRAKAEPKAPKAAAPAPTPVEPTPAPVVAEPPPTPASELDNVTPIKPKAKGKKA